jgi:hypothetical protein
MESTVCVLCARLHERWYELPDVQVAICRDCTVRTLRLIAASTDAELERIWLFLNPPHPRQPAPKDVPPVEHWDPTTKRFEPISLDLAAMRRDRAMRRASREVFMNLCPEIALRDVCEAVLRDGDDPVEAVGIVFHRKIFLPNAVGLLSSALFKS